MAVVKLVCSLDFDAASSAFSEAKNAFGAVQRPSDQEKVLKKSLGRLDMAEADTEVASDLVGDSNTATSVKDRAMLRKGAGHLLGGAERLVEQIIGTSRSSRRVPRSSAPRGARRPLL